MNACDYSECKRIIESNDGNAAYEMLCKLKKENEAIFAQLVGHISFMPIGVVCDFDGRGLAGQFPDYVNDLKIVLDKLNLDIS